MLSHLWMRPSKNILIFMPIFHIISVSINMFAGAYYIGLGVSSLDHRRQEEVPAIYKIARRRIYMCRGVNMCDVKKYNKIYEDIAKLQPDDTLQLVLEAETEEEKSFYEMVGDFLLQREQKQVIERNLF